MQIRKIFFAAALLIVNGIANADNGQTYTLDKRRYIGSLNRFNPLQPKHDTIRWDQDKYNQVVKVQRDGGSGTGTFISPKHVLTNKHVAECCGVPGTGMAQSNCTITLHDGTTMLANVVLTGGSTMDNVAQHCTFNANAHLANGTDWSVLELITPRDIAAHGNNYIRYANETIAGNVAFRAGFGALRILSNQDIAHIKTAYTRAFGDDLSGGVNLYRDNQYIHNANQRSYYTNLMNEYQNITRKNFLIDLFTDENNLKIIDDCAITQLYDVHFNHNCDSWAGDSGSALVHQSKIVGLSNSGDGVIFHTHEGEPKDTQQSGIRNKHVFGELTQQLINDAINEATSQSTTHTPTTTVPNLGDQCSAPDLANVYAKTGYYVQNDLLEYSDDDSGNILCANNINCRCFATTCVNGYTLMEQYGVCAHISTQQTVEIPTTGNKPESEPETEPAPEQTPESEAPTPTTTDANPDNVQQPRTAPARQRHTAKNIAIATAATVAAAATVVGIAANQKNKADKPTPQNTQPVAPQNNARAIGANCAVDDMPANAERGIYAAVNIKKLDCGGQQCACVATKCKNGYKLVHKQINGTWKNMGYCVNPKPCAAGKLDTDVINDVHIIRQHGGKFCK